MAALPARPQEIERLYTVEEFEQLPEFNDNFELIDGRLVEKPMPGYQHGYIADFIKEQYLFFDPRKEKGIMIREVSVILGPHDVPIPDAAYWLAEHRPSNNQETGAAPLPDLIIEVLSPRDLDTKKHREEVQAKIRRYQAAGVAIVWAINPKKQLVEIYHADESEPVQILDINGELDGEQVIPGFKIKVAELFK